MADELLVVADGVLEMRPFYSSNEWRAEMCPPPFRGCKFGDNCRFGSKCSHTHAPWRRCYKLW